MQGGVTCYGQTSHGGGVAGLEMTLRTCIKLLFTLRFVLDQRLARLEIQGSVMGCFNRARSNISKYTYLCIFGTKKYVLLLRIFIWARHIIF